MKKVIDFNKPVQEICHTYPESKEILREIGFDQITNPAMVSTVGKFMTLPRGRL